jgi:hypothetical protein
MMSDVLPVERIYNHDIMHCTADGVSGNNLYSARALGMTSMNDVIQLAPELEPEWDSICQHYERVGLEHTQQVIWDTRLDLFSEHSEYQPSVFFFGEAENSVVKDRDWAGVVNYINSKNNFMRLAETLGVPVPYTHCFDRVDQISLEVTEKFVFPCYLKAAISVSGVGIYRCLTEVDLLLAARNFPADTPVQVQDEVVTNSFLNMQYEVVNGTARRLLATEQILDGTAHQGNRYPVKHEPWELLDPMAEWMAEKGFKEVFAFDVAVIENEQGTNYLAIECNPRYNGASYPTAIARKLDIPEWEARNYKTWHHTLSALDLRGIEYDHESGEGVIIVNWGPIYVGKLMFLVAGTEQARKQLDMELRKRLW